MSGDKMIRVGNGYNVNHGLIAVAKRRRHTTASYGACKARLIKMAINRQKTIHKLEMILLYREDKTQEEQDNELQRLLIQIVAKGGLPPLKLSMLLN
jgi:hypothetical protein